MSVFFYRLAALLGIGVVEDSDTDRRIDATARRVDRLEIRVRALEAEVAARIDLETRGDSADPAN
jgi:hypothetical protein